MDKANIYAKNNGHVFFRSVEHLEKEIKEIPHILKFWLSIKDKIGGSPLPRLHYHTLIWEWEESLDGIEVDLNSDGSIYWVYYSNHFRKWEDNIHGRSVDRLLPCFNNAMNNAVTNGVMES